MTSSAVTNTKACLVLLFPVGPFLTEMTGPSVPRPYPCEHPQYGIFLIFHTDKSVFEEDNKKAHPRSHLLIIKPSKIYLNELPLLVCQGVGVLNPGGLAAILPTQRQSKSSDNLVLCAC